MAQQQQPSESKTPAKGGAGNASPNPDKANQITQKSAHQDSQQKRDAHSNSATAGSDEDTEDAGGGQHGSTKNLETEPDRARQADRNDERSRGK